MNMIKGIPGFYAMAMLLALHVTPANTTFSLTTQDTPMLVRYCELISNPTIYHGKLIATEAIELINIAPVLDGGEPFLYSPECDKTVHSWVLVDIYESSAQLKSKEIEQMILKAKENKNQQAIRAKVVIVGRFWGPKPNGGYGHLDWARFKIVPNKIDKVEMPPEETPWPSGYDRKN